jgi:hypothetical protein
MTLTFSPDEARRSERVAMGTLVLAAVAAVIVFFPAEGRLMAPLHNALDGLLGHATFVLPLGLALAATIALARRARPDLRLSKRRLIGVGLLALALLPSEALLGASTGVIGEWLTAFLIDLVGGPLTIVLVVAVVSAGAFLTFDGKKVAVAAS